MNLKQLRYFYEIANEGQITRAAKKLHIAQPPLSQSLKSLEEDLEVSLFDRHGRSMELTEAGKVLYDKAKQIFFQIDETITEVKETGKGIRGTLRIGCNKSCFSYIPKKFHELQTYHPNVKLRIIEGDSYYLSKQLIERELDVVICRLPIEMEHFDAIHLPEEEYVAVIPNELLDQPHYSTITINKLATLPLLLLHRIRGIGQYEIIINKFKELEVQPKIICESPNVDMLLGLVHEGLGATIVPESTLLEHNTENVSVLRIEDAKMTSSSVLIWLKDRYLPKAAEKFIDLFI
ncbi:LysR family transcriptional regulator [Pseudogracilibacillus sp. SO10305]|uniref:LysR family transcriptional regulator n=1 Tax=Pseudogracilibacillus sp. SO10305 TaxID=3098292 RepID=UPI00300DDD91